MSEKSSFDASHIYSAAAEAAPKRRIDEQIMGGDFSKRAMIDMNSEDYLKELIKIASAGKSTVSDKAKGMQFFIVKGGAEGFLHPAYAGNDASRVVSGGGATTSASTGIVMVFDNNDLIAAFGSRGKLVSSALLRRPISIVTPKRPHMWTEGTANKVYKAWNGRPVSLYRNTHFDVKYYGLMVDDSEGYYSSGRVRIDIHKQEATNGCIFIVDSNTPQYSKTTINILSAFEPKFIKDIQAAIGASARSHIGTMHMIEIK